MRAGHLKKVIGIEKFTITLDTYGEEVVSYTPLQNVRASINPISGNEKYMNSQLINEVSIRLRLDIIQTWHLIQRIGSYLIVEILI